MLTIIRKNQQFLMTLVVILTIVSFIWLYNRTNLDKVGTNDVLSINGRVVQKAEIDGIVRGYRLAFNLSLTDFISELGGMEASEETSLNNYIINLLVAQHQAEVLGVRPTDEAVLEAIKSLPPLQTDGAFDPIKYAAFIQERLTPSGLTEHHLEEIVRDSLKVQALHRIVTSPLAISEGEVRAAARVYQPVTAQVTRFDREKFLKDVSVTQEEVSAFYEKNKKGLGIGEARSISYATLELPEEQQGLSGKERMTELQKLADQVVTAGKAIRQGVAQGGDFAKLAEKSGLHADKVASVQRDGSQDGKDSELPAAVVSGAFRLQKSGEVSDIIQDGDSFYILTVDGITPARQLALSEVAEKIATHLKAEKASKLSIEAAYKSLNQIRAALNAGKSFADAAKAAGVQTQTLAGIAPSDTKNSEEQRALAASTLSLKDGELGQLQPAPWGAFAIYLDKRTPLTEAQWKEHQPELSKRLLGNNQTLIFKEWLNQSRGAAGIKMLGAQRGGG
jgi:peptidyl-prolyl cis-trans isomerase D